MSRTTLLSTVSFALAIALAAPAAGAGPAHPASAPASARANVLTGAPTGALTGVAGVRNAPGANALPGRSRAVRMDRKAMRGARLRLNLGVGPDLDVVRERDVLMDGGRRAWIGRVAGDPDSQVVLTSSGEAVAGSIRSRGRLFSLTPAGNGVQRIEEVDPSDPLPSSELLPAISPDLPDAGAGGGGVGTTSGAGGGTVIDLLMVYTPAAMNRYGGASGIEAMLLLAVEETNQAFLNSAAPLQLRLVGTAAVAYTESGDMNTDLTRLTLTGDGHMDEVALLRDEAGADLVSLIVDTGGYCGVAWQMGALNPAYAAYAFSAVKTTCLTGYYAFAHEAGHNLGLSHDHANASSGLFPYSFGYQDPGEAFRTIMAYSCTNGCMRIQHFSNPQISYAGAATGVAGWADAALALTDTGPLVATWRESVLPFPPLPPTDLTALAIDHERVDLAWSDVTDEDGYLIERSGDGLSFVPVANLPADSTGYSGTGLTPETGYTWRVAAYNAAGTSAASNLAWATTGAAPQSAPTAPADLAAAALSGTAIALTWTDLAGNETGFEIERSADGGGTWTLVASLGADAQDWTDDALAGLTTYDYRVRALGAGGTSGYSNTASATTLAVCSVQGAPSLVLSNRYADWNLTNTAGNPLTISAVELVWPKVQGNLRRVSLGGSAFWSGNLAGTSANLTGGWTSDPARVLETGGTEHLRLDFALSSTKDKQTDYHIVVHFAEGCSVAF